MGTVKVTIVNADGREGAGQCRQATRTGWDPEACRAWDTQGRSKTTGRERHKLT